MQIEGYEQTNIEKFRLNLLSLSESSSSVFFTMLFYASMVLLFSGLLYVLGNLVDGKKCLQIS